MVLLKILKEYMLYLQRHFKFLCTTIFIAYFHNGYTQKPIKTFYQDSIATLTSNSQLLFKKYPSDYKDAISVVLIYFPELTQIQIKFRVKKKITPLSARPTVFSAFRKASKRKYIVTISKKTLPLFSPILLKNLSFNSQVGVLGHEVSHISFYNKQKGIYFLKLVLMQLSKKYIDKFENNTDKLCIDKGLGYQLLSWSSEVRQKLDLKNWKGVNANKKDTNERYMTPLSIITYMNQLPFYK